MSIPHGGLLDPEHIPDRECHCDSHDKKCPIILKNDGYTLDLGLVIIESMTKYKNMQPYCVINNLKRSKLDPNRDIQNGAQDNAEVVQAFQNYHNFIRKAKTRFKRGLLIDLHGQHTTQVTELGTMTNIFIICFQNTYFALIQGTVSDIRMCFLKN